MSRYYFQQPFATAGDTTPIPEPVQGDGSVSFNQGFGFDYQREQGVDPDAKDVPREETNYLYYVITGAIQNIQQWGCDDFITSADNGGSPFSYGPGAMVAYTKSGDIKRVWISLVNSNTTTPDSSPASWQALGSAGSLPTASTTVAGITAYATNAETITGTEAAKAVTPAGAAAAYLKLSGGSLTGAVTSSSTFTATGFAQVPSVRAAKQNIEPLNGAECVALLESVGLYEYDRLADGGHDYGTIVDDLVGGPLDFAIVRDEAGEPIGFNYHALHIVTARAVQYQAGRLRAIELALGLA